jgi:hypothetical protein
MNSKMIKPEIEMLTGREKTDITNIDVVVS